jgi:hypothetical protein
VKKSLLSFAILVGLATASIPTFSREAPVQTLIQTDTSLDNAGSDTGQANDSPTPQEATPLDPAAATQAWLDSVPKEERKKSDAYF